MAGTVLAIVLVGWGGANVASLLGHRSVHHHREFPGGVQALDLHISAGSITVVGTDGAIVVDAQGSEGLNTPSDDETRSGGTLTIRSGCGVSITSQWCSLSYRISVPRSVTISAHGSNGSITATGIIGAMQLTSTNGSLHVDGATQPLTLHTRNGTIRLTGATSPSVTATSSNGSIHLGFDAPPQTVTTHSSNGGITIGLPDTTDSYQVNSHTSNGSVHDTVRTFSGAERTITASTSNGGVTVRYGPA